MMPTLTNAGLLPALGTSEADNRTTHFPSVNTFTIAGYTMPGKWTLTDASKKFGWQIQQSYGQSGAVVFPSGDELIMPKFKGQIWVNSDKALFDTVRKRLLIKPTYQPGSSRAVNALGINHPELKAMGVLAVVVGTINPLVDAGGGLWETTIEFIQYRSPLPVPAPPSQVIPDAQSDPNTTALEAADVQLQLESATLDVVQSSSAASVGAL